MEQSIVSKPLKNWTGGSTFSGIRTCTCSSGGHAIGKVLGMALDSEMKGKSYYVQREWRINISLTYE